MLLKLFKNIYLKTIKKKNLPQNIIIFIVMNNPELTHYYDKK